MEYLSHAKINLFLDVIKKKNNGFHEILSIFSSIDLYDIINYEVNKLGKNIIIDKYGTLPEDNLLKKASDKFINYIGKIPFGINFIIEKKIPLGGGLGGGSSNAAAVLNILNKIWNIGLNSNILEKLGSKLGSDIPYFINGGLKKVYGTGNKLKKLKFNKIELNLLMIRPPLSVSTPLAYKLIDDAGIYRKSQDNLKKYQGIIKGFKTADYQLIIDNIYNKFEEVVFNYYPVLKTIKNEIMFSKADAGFMSGSGSTMLGIYRTADDLEKGRVYLLNKGYNCSKVKLSN
jgi:4-diphosphocytidyl-2-C-methyl-D-erythritol kinase